MYLNVKRCRKVLAVFLGMCLVLSGCSKKTEETTNDISLVKLKSNQEIVACKITAIYGNEIEYTVVKEQSASDSNSKKGRMPSASGAPDMNGGSSQGGGAPDMNGGERSTRYEWSKFAEWRSSRYERRKFAVRRPPE
ncbi:hypothetical protein DWZ63_00800 [Clostridium sp. AF34-13]|uniref:hypothetical protein n=1 Tax=Clostridium sp. AF34-13 TaxID=2293012 RepID=UPI000E4AF259|nr:hypothetical protein [Clostridium sp. AF34-13]RHP28044.1 hypothetical protein DWZ63_00800 [Clostridium sp. AF34-13]